MRPSDLGSLSNDDNDSVKKNWFYQQNNCSARASRFLVHSNYLWRPLHDYDVQPPNATFQRGRGHWQWQIFLYLNMDKSLKNSTPGKVAYIWRTERFQIDAMEF